MQHWGTVDFETERLICRRFVMDDLNDMHRNWASDPMVQNEYGEPAYETVYEVCGLLKTYIDGYLSPDKYRWAIIEKRSNANIGQIAFCRVYPDIRTAEIEYCIGRAFWGNGYAGEVLEGLIRHTFSTTEFEKLEAYHRIENVRSGKVLARSRMHLTDTVERFRHLAAAPEGEVCYCIHRDEYGCGECTEI